MKSCYLLLLFIIILFIIPENNAHARRCSRYPSNTLTPKSPVDENFVISITGNPRTYIMGQSYNVSLQAFNGHRFISAKVVLENENGEKSFNGGLGHLEIVDPVETRYSQQCVNMIESTNTNPKTRLNMIWIAPSEPVNGCVLIRATVLQHRDVWFMDDGGLTKRVCEEIVDDLESQQKDVEERPCCACDEARYELTFEALWSRNLHPKDFPTRGWLTRFTDIIGAAHTSDYRFWDKGELASAEMQEFAEHGSSRGLETEFNQYFKEGKIRTIIKARGPAFPSMNSPSVASVRVDPMHHQISIASKIMPSPDWIVGITGLEICQTNCTWLEEKIINLYPWDVGTDAGPSYTSPDQPQFPPDVVRRMSSEYPPDPRSPFFDETGAPMKPLATLSIKRQRIYYRKCEAEESNNPDNNFPRECFTHPWSTWSKCTAECGWGVQYRNRVYKQPDVAKIYNCDAIVGRREERPCQGQECTEFHNSSSYGYNNYESNQWSNNVNEGEMFIPDYSQLPLKSAKSKAECLVGNWSPWSSCNVTCGEGVMKRQREYVNPYNERECQKAFYVKLRDYKKCQGFECLGHISDRLDNNNDEDYNDENLKFETSANGYRQINYQDANLDFETNANGKRRINYQSYKGLDVNDNTETNANMETEKPAYNFQAEDLRQELSFKESESYANKNSRPYYQIYPPMHTHAIAKAGGINSLIKLPPDYCYQPLNIVHNCIEPNVVGNFWFYNYCTDECMLYAADICDNNRNKFLSLEQCEEHCATTMRNLPRFLKQKQAQGCHVGQLNERYFKKRKNYLH